MEEFRKIIAEFENNTRTRKYEYAISEMSKTLTHESLEPYILAMKNSKEPMYVRFSCFFLLFTYYRKNNFLTEMKELVDDNYDTFKDQFLFYFIYLMKEDKLATINQLDKILENGEKHLDFYKDYVGYLNLYVEICAKYYEVNLDLRGKIDAGDENCESSKKKKEGNERLNKAIEAIETCCKESSYHKFFVNKGRILALLGDYDQAEKFIHEGISKVTNDTHHDKTVASYERYYNLLLNIITYDKAQETIRLCEKKQEVLDKSVKGIQIDNFKNLSILSTVIAFLLGGVEAFANISDYFVIGKVMLMYAGLFLCLIGFISLLSTLSIFKFKQKILPNCLSILLVIIGILIFALTIII